MSRIHGKFRVTLAQVQNSNAGPRRAWPDAGRLAVKHQATITRNDAGQFSSPSLTDEYVRIYCENNHLTRLTGVTTMPYFESAVTSMGNSSYSRTSQAEADERAAALDANGCTNCTRCKDCKDCTHCADCTRCKDCTHCADCTGCTHCKGCVGCVGCTGCTGCTRCTRCWGCWGCTDCTDCTDCAGKS